MVGDWVGRVMEWGRVYKVSVNLMFNMAHSCG